jgi:hypothetical protein
MDAPDTNSDNTADATGSNPYIRTFAQDFARLSGKAPESTSINSSQKKNLFPKKQDAGTVKPATRPNDSLITSSDEQHQPVDLSVLEHQAEKVHETTPAAQIVPAERPDEEIPEPISLPRIDPGDIVRQIPKPVPPPAPLYVAPEPQPSVAPAIPVIKEEPIVHNEPTPAISPLPDPVPVDSEREAILARLKARVASHISTPIEEPVVQTPPVFVAPPVSVPIPAPISTPKVFEPVPIPRPIPVQATAVPAPTPTPPKEATSEPLHTYKSDFADHLQEQGGSAFSVIAAEKDAPRSQPARRKSTLAPRIAIILGAFVFILAGVGAIYEAYLFMNKTAPVPLLSTPTTLIVADSSVALSGTGQSLLDALAQEATQPLALDHIVNTYVTVATTTSQGQIEEQGTGGALISELNLPAPDILLRNIDPSSMVGIVNAGGETRPFFILRVTSYERTFSGMLTWEPTMYSDLAELYPKYPAPTVSATALITPASAATSTGSAVTHATSTQIFIPPSTVDQTQPATQFTDEIVANHAARVLTDLSGRTLLIYGYADKQTLIIARNEAAFTFLLSRLQSSTSNQ